MLVFVVRRLFVACLVLLASTALMFVLVVASGDPLADLVTDTSPGREAKIAIRRQRLDLDSPLPLRYLHWLRHVGDCLVPAGHCTLGLNRDGVPMTALLGQALSATLRLVVASVVLAILLGVAVGIISALRQYRGLDYAVTLTSFLFFSLPVFWVAVLLKDFLGIKLNDWLRSSVISWPVVVVLAVASAVTWSALLGGSPRHRAAVAGAALVLTAGLLEYLSLVRWFSRPGLGVAMVFVLSLAGAVLVTQLAAGIRNRTVLRCCLATCAAGLVAWYAIRPVIDDMTWGLLAVLALVDVAVCVGIGYALGGRDRPLAIGSSVLTGILCAGLTFLDRLLVSVPDYVRRAGGLVGTVGSNTPNFSGNLWQRFLDTTGHLVLPTLALMLISFATYARFTRATMLEVLTQDFIRTARAKGLSERAVVLRHAFRNALIPVATLAAVDFGAVVGGALITESVFARPGMGALFRTGLQQVDPNAVMGFYIVTATAIVVFNLLADIAYGYLDPRIRLA